MYRIVQNNNITTAAVAASDTTKYFSFSVCICESVVVARRYYLGHEKKTHHNTYTDKIDKKLNIFPSPYTTKRTKIFFPKYMPALFTK